MNEGITLNYMIIELIVPEIRKFIHKILKHVKKILDKNISIQGAIAKLNEEKIYERVFNSNNRTKYMKTGFYFNMLMNGVKDKKIKIFGINNISEKLDLVPVELFDWMQIKDIPEDISSLKVFCKNKDEHYTDLRISKKEFSEFYKKKQEEYKKSKRLD
jgi:hypothetical protein